MGENNKFFSKTKATTSIQYSPEDIQQMTTKIQHLLETKNSHNISFAWKLIHNFSLNKVIWKNMWQIPLKTSFHEKGLTIRGHWDKRFRQVFHKFISRCPPFERNNAAEKVTRHLAVMYVIEHKSQLQEEYPPFFNIKICKKYFSIYASCLIKQSEKEYFQKTFLSSRSQKFFQSDYLNFGFRDASPDYCLFNFKAIILKDNYRENKI